MITLDDLNEAIAKCYGKRDQTPSDCVKLAAYMTIREQLYGSPEAAVIPQAGYSYAAAPANENAKATIEIQGGSEFAEAANGMPVEDFAALMDDLVDAVRVVNPRLYAHLLYKVLNK